MYIDRIKKIQTSLKKQNIDALLVANPYNVYYLSGFRPMIYKVVQPLDDPEGYLLVTQNACILLTDQRYEGTALDNPVAKYIALCDSPRQLNLAKQIFNIFPTISVLGVEEDSFTYKDLNKLKQNIVDIKNIQILDCSDMILKQRVIKDEAELKLLTQAAQLTSAGFEYALSKIKKGITEKELAFEITTFFLKEAEGNSFDPIVAFKEGSAIPHYETSENIKIASEGILLIDLGCIYKGYCGDMTRTIYLGNATNEFKEKYNYVREAQQAALNILKPGITGKDVHAKVINKFKEYNVEKYFTHGTGHGLGLAIHENPRLNAFYEENLANGMIFSVEPGLYINNWGGIRIEDVVYLQNDTVVNITSTPKDILEIKF